MVTNDNFVWGIGSGNMCNFKYHIQQLNQTENKVGATVFQNCLLAMVFPLVLWLASMHTLSFQKHRILISVEAESDTDDLEAHSSDEAAQIWALVCIKAIRVYHSMLQVPAGIKRQLKFWQQITGKSLHGEAFIFDIEHVIPLACPVDVQQFGASRFRSLVAPLEPEQGPRLLGNLESEGLRQDWVGESPPSRVLRAPRPFIQKVLNGTFSAILLPHLPNKKRSGSSGLTMNWQLCGFTSEDVPVLPGHASTFPDADSNFVLDTNVLDEAIDFLQAYAATILTDVEDADFENVEYLALQRCVGVFQRLLQGMDPSAFVRSAREMTGKGNAFWYSSRRPYQVAFLVKAVTMANLLRTAGSMQEVLQSAAGILLPEVLQAPFKHMLETCRHCTPHESTISRWKLLLDGAFMLFQRRTNTEIPRGSGSGAIRYLMADASTQHGRDFEHIMVASVKASDVCLLFRTACSLLDTWNLGFASDSAASGSSNIFDVNKPFTLT